MDDLIVLIPGITGSVLKKHGSDIWAPSFGAIANALLSLGKNLETLSLDWDDPDVEDLGDGITATGLIQDAVIVPGFVKIDGYTKISGMIRDCFEVTPGVLDPESKPNPPANFFEFPYDWRRDNRLAARHLKELIDLRLPQWRAYTDDPDAKVIIIAHSMGGIIARHYLEVLGGSEHCKALITFGTPYKGSLNALDFLANGLRKGFVDISEMMRTFTSVYQLLPIYEVVSSGGALSKVADLDIKGVNRKKAKEALEFHNAIMGIVDDRRKASPDPYVIFPVVGSYQPTLQSAELSGGKLTVSEALPGKADPLLAYGDGTVPYLSAIPHELSDEYRNSFSTETHGSLQCNDDLLDFLYDQLKHLQVKGLKEIRGPEVSFKKRKRAAISLRAGDYYSAGEPVVISARVLEEGRDIEDADWIAKNVVQLVAEIERSGGQTPPLMLPLINEGTHWALAHEGLTPGVYRVEVRASHAGALAPQPVHELFEVGSAA